MTSERIKGNVGFCCDMPGCTASLETCTGDFGLALQDARQGGWLVRNWDGEWKHFCGPEHEQAAFWARRPPSAR